MDHDTIPIPDPTPIARTLYVADCLAALREGRIGVDEASIIYARVMGWSDAGTDAERALYRRLAGEWCAARRAS